MKALILEKPGPPDTLKIAEQPLPLPGPDQVRVKVMAVGLNPVDYKTADWDVPSWSGPTSSGWTWRASLMPWAMVLFRGSPETACSTTATFPNPADMVNWNQHL